MLEYLPSLMEFLKMTNKFIRTERAIKVPGLERYENDAEHSYQLAMAAWYFIAKYNLPFDLALVLKYTLIHDLVEVYAGDSYIYDKNQIENKAEREAKAADQLAKEFPEIPEAHDLIKAYEKRVDKESRFVWTLDKVLPVVNIYIDDGRAWHERNVTIDMLLNIKTSQIKEPPELLACFEELVAMLREDEAKLFPKT